MLSVLIVQEARGMIRDAKSSDLDNILEIYNDAILNTTAVYDYKAHTLEDMLIWLENKKNAGFPVIVFEEDSLVLGFATFGPFRLWPAYKYTIEHSVYVHKDYRGKSIGTKLVQHLIKIANDQEYAMIVAGIDSSNRGSLLMHEKLGFTNCGIIRKVGYKFGRWLDLIFYQYELDGPDIPKEG